MTRQIPKDWKGSYWVAWQAGRKVGWSEASFSAPSWWLWLRTFGGRR